MVVYLDAFMGLNFLVDLALMLGVNRLSGYPPGILRAAAGAALGGGYAGMCLVPGFRFLGNALWRGVSLGLMSWLAFGSGRGGWSRGMLFVVLSLALGGLAMGADANGWGILACAGALGLLCRMGFRRNSGRRLVPLELTYRGRTLELLALVDTGNTLRDPITGEPVTVLSPEVGLRLGLGEEVLHSPGDHLQPGIRLVPCGTALGGGMLALIRCDRVMIGGQPASGLVAFAREPFGHGEYQALTGGQYG